MISMVLYHGPQVVIDSTAAGRSPNEVLSIDAGVFVLLKHHFQQMDPVKYANFVDAVLDAQHYGVVGRTIHLNLVPMLLKLLIRHRREATFRKAFPA